MVLLGLETAMAGKMRAEGGSRASRVILPAIAFLYSVSILIPWTPREHEAATDFSWILALHFAFVRHLRFGSDIIYTYGPWGFLWGGYHSATYVTVLVLWLLLSIVFVYCVWAIARRAVDPAASAIAVVFFAVLVVAADREALLLVLPFLLFLQARRQEPSRWVLLAPLLAAVALAGLIKFSVFVLALVTVLLVTAEDVVRFRRFPLAIVTFSTATLAWWLAASQRLLDFVPFTRYGFEIARTYGETMGRSESTATDTIVVCTLIASTIAAAGVVISKRTAASTFLAAGALLFTATAVKAGFVRPGGSHTDIASVAIILCALLVAFETWPSMRRRSVQVAIGAVCVVCGTLIALGGARRLAEFNPFSIVPWVDGERWSTHRTSLSSEFEQRLAPYRDALRDVPFAGTVDAYPMRVAAIAGSNGYAPRPVPQSYVAHSASLARLNAEHISGSHAPQWILFDIDPIDGRLPSIDDSLSWPVLLRRYEVARRGADVLLLRRKEEPNALLIHQISRVSAAFDQNIEMPPRPLWVAIDVEPTLVGRIAALAFRTPPLMLRARTADGVTRDYRILRDVARGGFLLSPLIRTRAEFALMLDGGRLENRRVLSIALIDASPRWLRCYGNRFELTLSELER